MELEKMLTGEVPKAVIFIVMYIVLFMVAGFLKRLSIRYQIRNELIKKDNLAVALTMSGYYFGATAIFIGALLGPSQGLVKDLVQVGGYSLLGLLFLNLSRWFNDKVILSKFCDTRQLVEEHNAGVGAVQCGAYLATGLIAAAAVQGQGGGVLSSLVFFVLGQLSLFVFSLIYGRLLPYNIHQELEKKNVAAGVAFGGTLVALAMIVMNGAAGDFTDWVKDLTLFAQASGIAFLFLPVIRFVMDRLVVPGDLLSREIKEDQNIGAGILEATVAISFAVILTRLM